MAPIPNRGDKRAFFDLEIGGEPAGRVVFSLWNYTCPKTVENFRNMCTGEMGELFGHRATYERSIFHRVIKGFMIQGGDITRRNGSGGFSIYGATFDDENLALKHNRPFLLSMANRGPDTNGSQFFITTEEVPHLDGKHCVFGEVIKGFDVVKRIENLETGENDVPTQKVQIVNCGEMVRKGDQRSSSKEDEPEIGGCKMDDEPRTYNWLMRRSRSPSPVGGVKKVRKSKRDRSPERRRRVSRERNGRERRSRSRSNDRHRRDDKKEERRPPVVSKDGVKVRGRGKLTFMGARTRSRTPPHWKKEESKKQTLSAHQKKLEEEEERKKRIAQRERLEAEHTARHEKERIEREAQRELDRQKKEARRELERQERKGSARRSSSSDSSSSEKSERSPSPYALSDPETPRRDRKQSRSPSPFSGKRSRRSADSDSD